MSDLTWKRACSAGGQCVEVAFTPEGLVNVRDSADRHGPRLAFTPTEWAAFLAGAKRGEFDRPADPGAPHGRGRCRHCGGTFNLLKDGTVRRHGVNGTCKGARKRPARFAGDAMTPPNNGGIL